VTQPSSEVTAAVTRAAGEAPIGWRLVTGGYTPAERWIVELDGGRSAFAKVATANHVAQWLRVEHRAYRDLAAPFMPQLLGWADEPVPVLLLEDLSGAEWPPPWDAARIHAVLATLDEVAATPCPAWADDVDVAFLFSGWSAIADEPAPFLALGLVTDSWLEAALPALIAHEQPAEFGGDGLLHFDVRSDNLCFARNRALLVDWNWVSRGNSLFDVAAWLPSLAYEGGPLPEQVRPEAGVFAPALAGYFCSRAPLPPIADAPHVRRVQREQATTALPWAARWLGLPTIDGPRFLAGA
jgi:hypothetical protein